MINYPNHNKQVVAKTNKKKINIIKIKISTFFSVKNKKTNVEIYFSKLVIVPNLHTTKITFFESNYSMHIFSV